MVLSAEKKTYLMFWHVSEGGTDFIEILVTGKVLDCRRYIGLNETFCRFKIKETTKAAVKYWILICRCSNSKLRILICGTDLSTWREK